MLGTREVNTEIVSSCLGTEQRGRLNIRNKRSECRDRSSCLGTEQRGRLNIRNKRSDTEIVSSCLGTEQRGRLNIRNKRSEYRDSQFVFRHRTERTSEY